MLAPFSPELINMELLAPIFFPWLRSPIAVVTLPTFTMGKFVYVGKLPEFLDGKNLSWVSISQDEKAIPTFVTGVWVKNYKPT